MITEEERYWIWLASLPNVGPVKFYKILSAFIDLQTAWENIGALRQVAPSISEKDAEEIESRATMAYLEPLLSQVERSGLHVLTRLSPDYPSLLAEIDNPPPVLYVRGTMPRMEDASCGIVGTRRPTKKGFEAAKEIAAGLAAQGVVIVSGMARGVDTAAHTGALDVDGVTVAVLGCGADVIYPPENDVLYGNIQERGAIVSEFFPGTEPHPGLFPQRNRVISGLSRVLVAGEGGKKSGARITVDHALQQGRDVYALACDLRSPVADLPLYLVDAGAPMLSDPSDLMADQGWKMRVPMKNSDTEKNKKLDFTQTQIYNLLLAEDLYAEEIASKLGISISEVNTAATFMELEGHIERNPGGSFSVHS